MNTAPLFLVPHPEFRVETAMYVYVYICKYMHTCIKDLKNNESFVNQICTRVTITDVASNMKLRKF